MLTEHADQLSGIEVIITEQHCHAHTTQHWLKDIIILASRFEVTVI